MNTTIKTEMTKFYMDRAYSHTYLVGFTFKGTVYYAELSAEQMAQLIKLDKAGRGQGYSLRFKPNTGDKFALLSTGAKVLCSVEHFKALVESCKYNKGEVFERLLTELYGQTWVKDNVPFDKGADLEAEGKNFQIKFEQATYITEAQMLRMRAREARG